MPLSKFLKMDVVETNGPSSYATGGFSIVAGDLRVVEHAIAVASGGYVAEVAGISGNAVTVKLYSGAGTEVANGTDVSGVNVTLVAWGV